MTGRDVLRSVAIALTSAVAVVAGFLSLASLPWWTTLVASLSVGSIALLADLLLLRPHHPERGRRPTLQVLGVIAAITTVVSSFALGRYTQSAPKSYPFTVTGTSVVVFIKAAPMERSQTNQTLDFGMTVSVKCSLVVDGMSWYQLTGGGWLNEDDAVPAMYSGKGSPPECPD